MKITLTLWQRLNLEGVMQQQRQLDGRDYLALVDLWRKITVSDSVRKDNASRTCSACGNVQNGSIWNREKIDLAAPLEIEIEKGEARVALDLLKNYKLNVVDSEWFLPLKAALLEVTGDENPAAAAPPGSGPAARRRPGTH